MNLWGCAGLGLFNESGSGGLGNGRPSPVIRTSGNVRAVTRLQREIELEFDADDIAIPSIVNPATSVDAIFINEQPRFFERGGKLAFGECIGQERKGMTG